MPVARRTFLSAAAVCLAGAAHAETFGTDFRFEAIEGGTLDLASYRGRALLVVNTASFCGFTYQYKALEALYATRSGQGLTVIGIPSQDFNQEKDSNGEVKAFCDATFGVKFPMAGLTRVTGPQAHPFYRWVSDTQGWQPKWNFYKVLLGRDGRIAGMYGSEDEPNGASLSGRHLPRSGSRCTGCGGLRRRWPCADPWLIAVLKSFSSVLCGTRAG